jgi:hypothetical protein
VLVDISQRQRPGAEHLGWPGLCDGNPDLALWSPGFV